METQAKEGGLYTECTEGVKFPRVIRVKRIEKMGPLTYVFFEAANQAAQAAHPNGGFIPFDSFSLVWTPLELEDSKHPASS